MGIIIDHLTYPDIVRMNRTCQHIKKIGTGHHDYQRKRSRAILSLVYDQQIQVPLPERLPQQLEEAFMLYLQLSNELE